MAEHSNNPEYKLIENLTPEITAASNANSAEVMWVGKYSHSLTCGNWIESVSKYSEIVTWEEIPCSATSGTEIVNYSVDWHGVTITGTISVEVEKCPCEYQVADEWYEIKEIAPLEESLDPDDTEIHIPYTIERHTELGGNGCETKRIVETIYDELILKIEPIRACKPDDTVITDSPVHWAAYGPEIGSKYYPIRRYPSTLEGDIPRNPRICCQGSSTQECQGINNAITYLKRDIAEGKVRYVETTLFPAETDKVYVSYDKTVSTQGCNGEDILVTLHVDKKEITIQPNPSTTKQETREIKLESGCGTIEIILDRKTTESIVTQKYDYELSDSIYTTFGCKPELEDSHDVYTIINRQGLIIKLNYILIKKTTITYKDDVEVSKTTSICQYTTQPRDNFNIQLAENDTERVKKYELKVTINYYEVKPDLETTYGDFIWYTGGRIYVNGNEISPWDMAPLKPIIYAIPHDGCLGITQEDYDEFSAKFNPRGEIHNIKTVFETLTNGSRWFQYKDGNQIVIHEFYEESVFKKYVRKNGTLDEETEKYYIQVGNKKYYEDDYSQLDVYEFTCGPECFIEQRTLTGTIFPITQKPCDKGPGDSSQDCFPKKYLKVNDGSQVFIRERMEATQENEFRKVSLIFSGTNNDHESIFYPDTINHNFDNGNNTAVYKAIPWEIVKVTNDCNETTFRSGTISASQGYSASTICSNDEYIMYNATQVLSASSDGNNVAWTSGLQPVGDNTLYSEVIFTMEIQLFGECIESDPCNGKTKAICFNGATATIGSPDQPLGACVKTAQTAFNVTAYALTATEDGGCVQSTESTQESVTATISLNSKTPPCDGNRYQIPFTAVSLDNGDVRGTSNVEGTSATFGPGYTLAEGCNNQTFTVTVYQTCGCDSDCEVRVHITPAMPGIVVHFDDAENTSGITNNEGYVVFEGGETTKTMSNPHKATVDAGSTFDGNEPIAINDCDEDTFLAKWNVSTASTDCGNDVELALATKKVTATTGGCWTRVTQKGDVVLLRTREYPITLTASTSTTTVGQAISFTKSPNCSYDTPDTVTIQVDGEPNTVNKSVVWKEKDMSVTAIPEYVGTDGGTITISHETCVPTMADELYVHVIPEHDTISYEGGNMNITYFASYSDDPSDTESVVDVNDIQLTWDNPDVIANGPATHSGGIHTQPVVFPLNDTENNINVKFTATTPEADGEATVTLLNMFSLPPSDYLVFTYHWDDGEDLDSLTIINTDKLETKSTAFTQSRILKLNEVGVGFNACESLPVLDENNNPIDGVYYIQHGGDNRQTGNEGAMICWNNIINSGKFGVDDILSVDIYANWFASRESGKMTMSVAAYKGNGNPSNLEMKLADFVFEPINGTQKVYPEIEGQGVVNGDILAVGGGNAYYAFESYLAGAPLAYSKVATVKYNIKNKTPQIIPPTDPSGNDGGMIYNEHDITLSTAELIDGSYKYSNISAVKVYPSGQTVTFGQMCIVSHDRNETEEYSIFGVSDKEGEGQLFIHTPWKEDGTVSQLDGKTYKLNKTQFTSSTTPIIDTGKIKIYGWLEDDGNGKSRECMKFEIEPYSHASDLYIRIIPLSWVKLNNGGRSAIFKHQSPEDLKRSIYRVMDSLTVDIDLLKIQ